MSDERGVDLLSDINSGALDAEPGAVQQQVVPDSGQMQAPPGTLPAHLAVKESGEGGGSIRDHLSSAFKQAGDEQVPNAHTPGTPESNRRADGTFKSKEELDADTAKVAQAALAAKAAGPATAPQAIQPPASMSPAEATAFTSLSPEMQHYVARTAASVENQANSLREYGELQTVMTPQRVQRWAMDGLTPVQAHHQLYALSDFASTDPGGFMLWFAAQRDIDIGRLSQEYVPPDPALTALQNQLATVTQEVQQFRQGAQDQQLNGTISVIEQFATAKDAAGNPLRPHWNDLTAEIEPFIRTERAKNPNGTPDAILSAAYDAACWGNPTIRAKMQEGVEAQRLAGHREHSERARQAASSVTGAPAAQNGGVNDNANRTLRDELRAGFAKYSNAV